MAEATVTIKVVRDYFGSRYPDRKQTLKEFAEEWAALSVEAKSQIKAGIADGTLTY